MMMVVLEMRGVESDSESRDQEERVTGCQETRR